MATSPPLPDKHSSFGSAWSGPPSEQASTSAASEHGSSRPSSMSGPPRISRARPSVSGQGQPAPPGHRSGSHMESTVTRLLVATKQLLEGLAKWSIGQVSEEQISDIYVKLGNDFNVAVTAFSKEGISMSELLSVPSELRTCLEGCLAEDASQQTLEAHLPRIREIIIRLLEGLRVKQGLYRARRSSVARGEQPQQPRERPPPLPVSQPSYPPPTNGSSPATTRGAPMTPNTASRSRDDLRKFVTQAQSASESSSSASRSNTYPTGPSERRTVSLDETPAARPAPPTRERSLPTSSSTGHIPQQAVLPRPGMPPTSGSSSSVYSLASSGGTGGTEGTTTNEEVSFSSNISARGERMTRSESEASLHSAHSGSGEGGSGSPSTAGESYATLIPSLLSIDGLSSHGGSVPGSPTVPALPTIRPPSQSFSDEGPLTPSGSGGGAQMREAQIQSLETLKMSDALSRRASKRLSSYTMKAVSNVVGGSASPGRGGAGDGSTGAGGIMPGPNARERSSLRNDLLANQARKKSNAGRELLLEGAAQRERERERDRSPRRKKGEGEGRRPSLTDYEDTPPVPPLPASQQQLQQDAAVVPAREQPQRRASNHRLSTLDEEGSSENGTPTPAQGRTSASASSSKRGSVASVARSDTDPSPSPKESIASPEITVSSPTGGTSSRGALQQEESIYVYLQIGRDVKKGRVEMPPSIPALRNLFIERFQYNPLGDFPNIYIRDTRSGIEYELEDLAEVKEGAVICLNIDPVQQVKQHIDQGMSALTAELRDLKTSMATIRRPSVFQPMSPDPSMLHPSASSMDTPKREPAPPPRETSPVRTKKATDGDAVGDGGVNVADLVMSQRDELDKLRRELAIVRQLYTDFQERTKSMLANARAQTQHVSTLAATKASSSRQFVDSIKSKLETESANLVVSFDDVQDAIDQMRTDSVKRIRPRPNAIDEIAKQLAAVVKTRTELVEWMSTVKPSWKTTHTDEISRVIGEQKLFQEQEDVLADLEVDLKEARHIFDNIRQVAAQYKATPRRLRDFTPGSSASPDDPAGGGGLSTVLLEVKALTPNADKRLEALERMEKLRLENVNKKDDFELELDGFVKEGKLKRTGGVDEVERLRARKSERVLRDMFGGGGS